MNIEVIVEDKKRLTNEDTNVHNTLKECENILAKMRQKICRKYPILNNAIFMMDFVAVKEDVILETDGIKIFYSPRVFKKMVKKKEMKTFEKRYLHILLHGMLNHFIMSEEGKNDFIYHTLYDLEVNQVFEELGIEQKKNKAMTARAFDINPYREDDLFDCRNTGIIKMHKQLVKRKDGKFKIREKRKECRVDDHTLWGSGKKYRMIVEINENSLSGNPMNMKDFWGMVHIMGKQNAKRGINGLINEMRSGFGRGSTGYGIGDGDIVETVKAKKEATQNYCHVLKKFFEMREVEKEKTDSIDKGLYSWGFSQYGDIAFIETEDENEECALNTVVIAVDTSGSCAGDILEQFLAEIRQMFFELSNINFKHFVVLQCDAKITKEYSFKNKKDFPDPKKFEDMKMYGFGGTDFRPVFSYVDNLSKNEKVDCLIYLSDGEGRFPEKEPEEYETFFVLPYEHEDDDIYEIALPKWIHELTMQVKE